MELLFQVVEEAFLRDLISDVGGMRKSCVDGRLCPVC